MPDRRGFLGAVAALVAAPFVKERLPPVGWLDDDPAFHFVKLPAASRGMIGYYEYMSPPNPPPLACAIITDLKDPYEDLSQGPPAPAVWFDEED